MKGLSCLVGRCKDIKWLMLNALAGAETRGIALSLRQEV